MLKAQIPEAFEFLFKPARYKVAYGGRGGAKSWAFADALLIQCTQQSLRVLCAREFQNSIKDSVHQLLSDRIKAIGLDSHFDVQQTVIKGINGSQFAFEGLRHNVSKIKSYEGVDRVWVEEANKVSKASWETLIPTVRKERSEIWVSFNPELDTDETYKRFVITPPPNSQVKKVGWQDNPWFPEVLKIERDTLKARDPDAYLNIWEGNCRVTVDGAIYARELREAMEEGRITRVPHDSAKPVHTFWDLGWGDNTSIWFVQPLATEFRVIDFYQNRHLKLSDYVKLLREKPYTYGQMFLPHDAEDKDMKTGRSIHQMLRDDFQFDVVIVPKLSVEQGINAARQVFGQCWFDEQKCADGLQNLRHYRYEIDEDGQYSKLPLHDNNSHAADAFRYFAVGRQVPSKKIEINYPNIGINLRDARPRYGAGRR